MTTTTTTAAAAGAAVTPKAKHQADSPQTVDSTESFDFAAYGVYPDQEQKPSYLPSPPEFDSAERNWGPPQAPQAAGSATSNTAAATTAAATDVDDSGSAKGGGRRGDFFSLPVPTKEQRRQPPLQMTICQVLGICTVVCLAMLISFLSRAGHAACIVSSSVFT